MKIYKYNINKIFYITKYICISKINIVYKCSSILLLRLK